MNEFFAADPMAVKSEGDLRLLLRLFGPYAGRYLAIYPTDWIHQMEHLMSNARVIEGERIKALLRRAKERTVFVQRRSEFPWNPTNDWLSNALRYVSLPGGFDGLISDSQASGALVGDTQSNVYSMNNIEEIPQTAEERILAKPAEYARAAKTLILISIELALVDPYLNPLKKSTRDVLREIFNVAAKGKARKLTLWARHSIVVGSKNPEVALSEVRDVLVKLVADADFLPDCVVELVLVRDENSVEKLHERYLLSIKGGVRFDQGFQVLPSGRKVTASPISRVVHEELAHQFLESSSRLFHEGKRLSVTAQRK
jgi:hypothetical protein